MTLIFVFHWTLIFCLSEILFCTSERAGSKVMAHYVVLHVSRDIDLDLQENWSKILLFRDNIWRIEVPENRNDSMRIVYVMALFNFVKMQKSPYAWYGTFVAMEIYRILI